jgi:hypothetical protein
MKVHQEDPGPGDDRPSREVDLRLLTQHEDLTSVRSTALDSLPDDERRNWQAFWREVDAALQRLPKVE